MAALPRPRRSALYIPGSNARALLVGPGLGLTDATRSFVQHLLAGIDQPSEGRVVIAGEEVSAMSANALAPAGGDQPHNNMMPYLTFYFCIALQGVFPPRT